MHHVAINCLVGRIANDKQEHNGNHIYISNSNKQLHSVRHVQFIRTGEDRW